MPIETVPDPDTPSLQVVAPDGARLVVFHDGAHVTSWVPAGGTEQLFVSANARYGAGQAIRGGVPICWPQFGPFGSLPQHGFARVSRWALQGTAVDGDEALAIFVLEDSAATRAAWSHRFRVEYEVRVGGATLSMTLTVSNRDMTPFTFTGALHPYFHAHDAFAVHVEGLAGTRVRDALQQGREFDESHATVAIDGPIDRVYYGASGALALREPHRALHITMQGFADAVVWNPGAAGTASRADFVPGDERHMVCVEAAVVQHPVTLAPGASWTGVMRVRHEPSMRA